MAIIPAEHRRRRRGPRPSAGGGFATPSLELISNCTVKATELKMPATASVISCQWCDGSGHSAKDCPSRKPKDLKTFCQLCGVEGHKAKECEADDDGSSDGSDDAVSECCLCYAVEGEECVDPDCMRAVERKDRLEAASAKPPPTKKPKLGETKEEHTPAVTASGSTVVVKPDDILKMSASQLATLKVGQIVLLPPVWLPWLRSLPKAERVEAHRRLIQGIRLVLTLDRPSPDDKTGKGDLFSAEEDLEEVSKLLDPTGDYLVATLISKMQQVVESRGNNLRAYKEAKVHGWTPVRKAMELFKGEGQAEKSWTTALSKAGVTTSEKPKAPSPDRGSGGGRGHGRWKNKKGGGKGGGRGTAAAATDKTKA